MQFWFSESGPYKQLLHYPASLKQKGLARRVGPAATAALAASTTADMASSQADACDTHTRVCGGGVDAATGEVGRGRALEHVRVHVCGYAAGTVATGS